ncbi:conserved hypothetical protein [Candidatus Methylobacter favarea]|uniref:YbdD/YjiX family protein n=1 Tax=Candidatus Methylobacter favarea TaxID=2707345 RepID=A0A8S0X209_9GAMM|nr:YbdD/YjiX family protein [Candidatus Methylobacter favarea]CAA9891552.1 conserved hypothetical protein [Candidatus Methylobacter favarea]
MLRKLKSLWQIVRRLSGDDAYEQYLKHFDAHHQAHSDNSSCHAPLSKEMFFRQWQDDKWEGVKRCC